MLNLDYICSRLRRPADIFVKKPRVRGPKDSEHLNHSSFFLFEFEILVNWDNCDNQLRAAEI